MRPRALGHRVPGPQGGRRDEAAEEPQRHRSTSQWCSGGNSLFRPRGQRFREEDGQASTPRRPGWPRWGRGREDGHPLRQQGIRQVPRIREGGAALPTRPGSNPTGLLGPGSPPSPTGRLMGQRAPLHPGYPESPPCIHELGRRVRGRDAGLGNCSQGPSARGLPWGSHGVPDTEATTRGGDDVTPLGARVHPDSRAGARPYSARRRGCAPGSGCPATFPATGSLGARNSLNLLPLFPTRAHPAHAPEQVQAGDGPRAGSGATGVFKGPPARAQQVTGTCFIDTSARGT